MQISNINSIRTYPKICLTGGPCAGKTTAKNYIQQELIKQGYTVFFLSETATEVLKSGITPDTVGLYKFQKAVASLQIQKEELFSDILNHLPENIKPILICDRGVPDSKAFCHIGMYEAILEELQYDEKTLKDNYDLVLHLETIAKEKPELYGTSTNKVRRESVEEAINRDNDLIEVWTGMKNYRIIDNKNKTMDDKCHLIMDYINEYLTYTKKPLQYQIFETKNGNFHVLTKFETESQIDEFARTVGKNILSVSDLQILKENLTQNKKSEYCWNVSYYDIQDIPMEQRKVFETPDRIQKAPLLFSNLEKVRNYFQQYIQILDSKKIPYKFQELGVCSNALVFQNIYNKNEKLYGVLDQNGNPDILNEDGVSVLDDIYPRMNYDNHIIFDNKFKEQLEEQNIDIMECRKIAFLKDETLAHPMINYDPITKSLEIIDSKSIIFTDETKFEYFENLEKLILDNIDTSQMTNMSDMFSDCYLLETLDLSNFDTSKVKNMNYMFYGCTSLETLNLSNFDTSNIKEINGMFSNCHSLEKLDLSNFDISNVEDMASMFYNCKSLKELDLSNFNTSNVKNMSNMFSDCWSLKNKEELKYHLEHNTLKEYYEEEEIDFNIN